VASHIRAQLFLGVNSLTRDKPLPTDLVRSDLDDFDLNNSNGVLSEAVPQCGAQNGL
jgi:hypothetical protein